jgi:hypothetical protein
MLVLITVHMGVAALLHWLRPTRSSRKRELITYIFEGSSFAGSVLLLIGIFDDTVLRLIGGTKTLLMVAALTGIAYSAKSVLPPKD